MTLDKQPSQHNVEQSPPDTNSKSSEVANQAEIEKRPPKETIEEASNFTLPQDSFHLSPDELRKNFHTHVSGELAKKLWYLLGLVVVLHMGAVVMFSWRLTEPPTDNDLGHTERIETAISTVGDAAKTLYPVLTTLATAVTGYYFSTGGDSESEKDN